MTSAVHNQNEAPDRITLAAFAAFIFIGGSVAVVVRFTYREIMPYSGAFFRFSLAALIFWMLALLQRAPIPRGKFLAGAVLYGVVGIGLPFILVYYGLVKTPASVYSTIMSVNPLLTLFFASLHGIESIRRRNLFGALLAVAGIVLIMSSSLTSGIQISIPHALSALLAAACFAESGIIFKLIPQSNLFATSAIAMSIGSLFMLVSIPLMGETVVLPTSPGIWLALIYLATFGSVGTYGLYLFALRRWTASGMSYSLVLSPLVTIFLATTLGGESLTWRILLGAVLILAGVWFGALSGRT
jgi:drug/metabolite transporter (DMT)-like permease